MKMIEIENMAMAQAGEDPEDLSERLPYMAVWVNEGYRRLLVARYGERGADAREMLSGNNDEPDLPEWVHGALADWGAYRLLITGSASRQGRAGAFLSAFESARMRLLSEAEAGLYDEDGRLRMRNLYAEKVIF